MVFKGPVAKVTVVLLLPAPLAAVMVYVVAAVVVVGVPLMVPLVLLKLKPLGKLGLME
jgi:hypothetical protein